MFIFRCLGKNLRYILKNRKELFGKVVFIPLKALLNDENVDVTVFHEPYQRHVEYLIRAKGHSHLRAVYIDVILVYSIDRVDVIRRLVAEFSF